MSIKPTVASLFSGIGGIDLGFQQAGFNIIFANEIDNDSSITYKHNFPNTNLIEGNIKDIKSESIPDFDVLVAGFPCQPFSIAGKQRGFEDPRGNLFFEITRIVDKKRPKVIFLENVANLMEHDNGKTFLVIYNSLAQFGYAVRYKVMDAKEYGNVPQQRKRIFIVAFLDYEQCNRFYYPEPIDLTISLNDIIKRDIKHSDCYYYGENSFYYSEMIHIVTSKTSLYKINDKGVSSHKYYICPTLTANMGTYPDRVPILRDNFGIRKITPQECLALQGFPKEINFSGISLNSAYKQTGNSVAVPVVKRIAEEIKKVLD